MRLIRGNKALQAFREDWTGERMLELIRQHYGRVRVDWAIGVGKSCNLDQTIEAAIRMDQYDLVTALLPTRQIIQERLWIQNPPVDVRVVNLKPRPRKRCGELDVRWKTFETNGLGALGRVQICGHCPRRRGCYWPEQYGKKLQGVRVIFGTQAHLERSPAFMFQLTRWTGARRVLALLDEVNFIMTSFRQRISYTKLVQFIEVLSSLNPLKWGKTHRDWLYRCELLLRASTKDLRYPDWQMPPIFPSWSIAVQSCGWSRYSEAFKFLGYGLQQFGYSPLTSREKNGSGDLLFAAPPYLNCDFVILPVRPTLSSQDSVWVVIWPIHLKTTALSTRRPFGTTLHHASVLELTFCTMRIRSFTSLLAL